MPVNSINKKRGKNSTTEHKSPKYTILSSCKSPIDAPINPDINGLIGNAKKWTIGIAAETIIIMNETKTEINISLSRFYHLS